MNMENLPQAIALELRKRGEKRIKSVFQNHDGSLSVFLYGDLPAGKKSFNVLLSEIFTDKGPDEPVPVGDVIKLILGRAQEVLDRPDDVPEYVTSEEDYAGEGSS